MFAVANKRKENTLLSLFIHCVKGKTDRNRSYGFEEKWDNQGTAREYDCEVLLLPLRCCWCVCSGSIKHAVACLPVKQVENGLSERNGSYSVNGIVFASLLLLVLFFSFEKDQFQRHEACRYKCEKSVDRARLRLECK